MKLESIPEIIVDKEGNFKFVQLKCNSRHILYGNSRKHLHRDLYHLFLIDFVEDSEARKEIIPCGGGRINIDKEKRILEAYGYSDSYGRFNDLVVRDILNRFIEENMRGFSLEIS